MLLTFFGYNPDGSAQWYLSTGALTNSAFTGSLAKYERGTSFGAPLVPAVSVGNAGSVTISFSDTTHGLITLPGEAPKAISRFLFATAPAAFSGNWSGSYNGTSITYAVTQTGNSLAATRTSPPLAGLTYSGVINGDTADITSYIYGTRNATMTWTILSSTTIRAVVTGCFPVPGYVCGASNGAVMNLTRF